MGGLSTSEKETARRVEEQSWFESQKEELAEQQKCECAVAAVEWLLFAKEGGGGERGRERRKGGMGG